ncbi:MAG: 4-alpha-glucanotransferase [Dehalococcoidia bacterium]|nr:4-alpha-glucanotransferase [Dehalococcoidia bacterium]
MNTSALLEQLAALYGIQTSYYDMTGRLIAAEPEAILSVLGSLGAPVSGLEDVPSALRERRLATWREVVEPVNVVWDSEPNHIGMRLPSDLATASLRGYLKLESSAHNDPYWNLTELPDIESVDVEGQRYVKKRLPLPHDLPHGYHRLVLELPGKQWETLLIVAPTRAHQFPAERLWGVFLPLYALHTKSSWGAGDLSDMEKLSEWIASLGGGIIATLPILASHFDGVSPGPYTPVSRLFWNEFCADVRKIPEFERCPAAQALVNSSGFKTEIQSLRSQSLVDYDRQMALKRRVLSELARFFFATESERSVQFKRYLDSNKSLEDYARFRAAGERLGTDWSQWQERMRNGLIQPGDYDEPARQYHLYAQWVTDEQLQSISAKAKRNGPGLYLDLPIGAHPYSYDVWRERELFVPDMSVGAPPDPVFTSGQNWSFPPFHPEKSRTQGYRYFIASLRNHLKYAGMLRIDHVMGFHRLFWIPNGMKNSQGLYVRYHSDEFYAILAIESQRHRAIIVGEDLGLVPDDVRPAMDRHGIYRMYITQFELNGGQQAINEVPANAVASMNTHDMFPFASFWQDLDIAERKKLNLVDEALAKQEAEQRPRLKKALVSYLQQTGLLKSTSPDIHAILAATLKLLGSSAAAAIIINLEDLWLETKPQNIPGTVKPENWRRKACYSLEEFSSSALLRDRLAEIDRARKGDKSSK